jgi:DNA-binding winged helix-turn-helix (wHTH) protein
MMRGPLPSTFVYDSNRRLLWWDPDAQPVYIPEAEAEVLDLLVEARGRVVTHEEFCAGLSHWEKRPVEHVMPSLRNIIERLRNRLGDGVIWTVVGVGYCINPKAAEECPTCGRVK